jgi:dihydroneopterin aldolase
MEPMQTQPMDDAIRITGIRGYGYTGFFDAEQVLGQWFEVDLRLSVDLSRCGDDDVLAHTVDYSQVVQRVQTLLETSRCRTIERLATLVCDAVLTFPPVQRVEARVAKVAAPIPGFDGRIAIELSRTRTPEVPS